MDARFLNTFTRLLDFLECWVRAVTFHSTALVHSRFLHSGAFERVLPTHPIARMSRRNMQIYILLTWHFYNICERECRHKVIEPFLTNILLNIKLRFAEVCIIIPKFAAITLCIVCSSMYICICIELCGFLWILDIISVFWKQSKLEYFLIKL